MGVGQVIFLGSPACGAMVLGALGYADPWLGSLAALGTVSATISARVCGLDNGAISAGLMGYNGCLVGCAFSVFLGMPAWSPAAALATVAGAAASAPVAAALKPRKEPRRLADTLSSFMKTARIREHSDGERGGGSGLVQLSKRGEFAKASSSYSSGSDFFLCRHDEISVLANRLHETTGHMPLDAAFTFAMAVSGGCRFSAY